jgi:hypothetical protein
MAVLVPLATGCALAEDWDSIQAGTGPTYDNVVLDSNPLAYFPLNDAPGSTGALDLRTNTASPISDAGVTFTGTAASFDGTGYITLETAALYAFITGMPPNGMGLGAFSLEAWVLPGGQGDDAGTTTGMTDIFGEGTVDVGYNVVLQGDSVTMGVNEGAMNGCGTPMASFNPGQGFYFVGEYDGAEMAVYINGTNMQVGCGMGEANGAGMPTTSSLLLGSDAAGDENFVGTISHVAIYSTGLPQETILAHYMAGGSGP